MNYLDTGIRSASNTDSGEQDEVFDGEVSAHLGNPGPDGSAADPTVVRRTRLRASEPGHRVAQTVPCGRSRDIQIGAN